MKMFIGNVNCENKNIFARICEKYGYGGGAYNPGYGYTKAYVKYVFSDKCPEEKVNDVNFVLELVENGFIVEKFVPE